MLVVDIALRPCTLQEIVVNPNSFFIQIKVMAFKDSRQANSGITDIVFNPIVGDLMAFSTKDPNTTSTPTKFNRIVQEFIVFCYC